MNREEAESQFFLPICQDLLELTTSNPLIDALSLSWSPANE